MGTVNAEGKARSELDVRIVMVFVRGGKPQAMSGNSSSAGRHKRKQVLSYRLNV